MQTRVLVIGYGNPGRIDDGLGPAAAEALARLGESDVTVEAAYQLQVEVAAQVAEHDVVVFVDAAAVGPAPFEFRPVAPTRHGSFTTHSVSPETVLGLAHEHFDARASAYMLGIRGYEFEGFGEQLSDRARGNLEAAVGFLATVLRQGSFEEAAANVAPVRPPKSS